MNYDQTRIEEAVPALLAVFSFDERRSWKGFDFDITDNLHEKDFITKPKGGAKSVYLMPQGLKRGLRIAETLFGARAPGAG